MELLSIEFTNDGGARATFMEQAERVGEPSDSRILEVNITTEGVIIDAYEDDGFVQIGTIGLTADELFEKLEDGGVTISLETVDKVRA